MVAVTYGHNLGGFHWFINWAHRGQGETEETGGPPDWGVADVTSRGLLMRLALDRKTSGYLHPPARV